MSLKDLIIDFIKFLIKVVLIVLGLVLLTKQMNGQEKTYQLMDEGTWVGTVKIKKHSNNSPMFAMYIKNRTDKYIVLNVTFYDGKRIVLKDLIRVGKDYYLHKAFTCIDNLKIDIRQRTNVRLERQLEVL